MIFLVGLEGIPRRADGWPNATAERREWIKASSPAAAAKAYREMKGTDAAVWVNGEEKAITYVSVSYVFAQGATEPTP